MPITTCFLLYPYRVGEKRLKEITEYIEWVRSHRAEVCKKTYLATQRVSRIIEEGTASGSLVYDEKEVRKVLKFIGNMVSGETGKRLELLPWQVFFIACIYGLRNKDGTILFNDAFLFIGKKNGKTALAAGLALYNLISVPKAEVVLVATEYGQAKIAFEAICQYIRNTPALAECLEDGSIFIRESPPLMIRYAKAGEIFNPSKIFILPETQAHASQGFNATFALFDEIASYRTTEITTKIASGQARDNAIRISLTTAETNMQNPGRAEYDRAKLVLEGKYTASNYLPLIYELDDRDDRWNEKVYGKANPSMGITKQLRKILEDRARAKQNPVEEASYFAYQLNVWSQNAGTDIADDDWLPAIENARKYAEHLTEAKLATYPCFMAVDLSKIDDYTAYTIFFYIKAIDKYYAKHRFYIPAGMLEKKLQTETEQLAVWVKQGYVSPTLDGQGDRIINLEYLLRDIMADAAKYKTLGFTYDVAHASRENFIENLEKAAPDLERTPFAQGWRKISPANQQWLTLIYKKQLIDDNPVMRWMVGCVKIRTDRIGNTYFDKINYRQSPLRIDGVDTSVMALAMLAGRRDEAAEDVSFIEQTKRAIDIGTEYGY